MTSKTWVGGHDGNDAGSAANWSPAGAPQRGDTLNVVTGTLEISRTDLAGDVLHINDPLIAGGDPSGKAAPVVLDLNGNAKVGIDGSMFFGDPITINAVGNDSVDGSGSGFDDITGTVNLAANAHLFVTGRLDFAGNGQYGGQIIGGAKSLLTNNGMIELGSGKLSVAVNGHGTLGLHGYHTGDQGSSISAPIGSGQTVILDTGNSGLTTTFADIADFHGLLQLPPSQNGGFVFVRAVLDGVKADGFTVGKDSVTLTEGGKAVETLRVANAGAVPIAATYGADSTTLLFHSHPLA